MNFPFAHLVPDKYRHALSFDLTDPDGSYILTIEYAVDPRKHFGVDIRLKGGDMALSDREFADRHLIPAIVAMERHERARKNAH
jgi:hypothetical protein